MRGRRRFVSALCSCAVVDSTAQCGMMAGGGEGGEWTVPPTAHARDDARDLKAHRRKKRKGIYRIKCLGKHTHSSTGAERNTQGNEEVGIKCRHLPMQPSAEGAKKDTFRKLCERVRPKLQAAAERLFCANSKTCSEMEAPRVYEVAGGREEISPWRQFPIGGRRRKEGG